MAKALVKCKYCGIQFDRNSEPCDKVDARRYAHKECIEKYRQSLTQEERDYEELTKYIKQLFGTNVISARVKKQISDYKKEYNYTYSGIHKALYWFYEITKHSTEKANNGIGIVPYIYQEAKNYYYRIYMAKIVNDLDKVEQYKPKEIIIEIGSPRVRVNPPKLFDFDEK